MQDLRNLMDDAIYTGELSTDEVAYIENLYQRLCVGQIRGWDRGYATSVIASICGCQTTGADCQDT